MFENMHRLHPRGAANRGICVDADGAMLGPACVLVRRTARGFRGIERGDAAMLQKCVLDPDREEDWLYRQSQRIAEALGRGEIALAQIYGLRIPVGEFDDRKLERLAKISLGKAGYDPDEPRIPKGEPHAGEWTGEGGSTGAQGGDAGNGQDGDIGGGDRADGGNGGNSGGASPPPIRTGGTAPASGSSSGGGDGTDASSQQPPMKFEWPSNTSAGSPPPKAQDAASGPSTLGSPDLGSEPSIAASSEDGRSTEGDGRANPKPDVITPPPEIPAEKPGTTKGVNAVLRAVATWLARAIALYGSADPRVRMVLAALETLAWIAEYLPKIFSYLDSPRTLQELQDAVANPRYGYEIHHIVEARRRSDDPQRNAERFKDRIDSRENLVRIPYWKHVEISSWYSTVNKELGRVTPREYLRGKSWNEQYERGIETLKQFGVLK
jgi:hypothetical protein